MTKVYFLVSEFGMAYSTIRMLYVIELCWSAGVLNFSPTKRNAMEAFM